MRCRRFTAQHPVSRQCLPEAVKPPTSQQSQTALRESQSLNKCLQCSCQLLKAGNPLHADSCPPRPPNLRRTAARVAPARKPLHVHVLQHTFPTNESRRAL